jgi:tRNA threonylcarbamoyladenosine biosynthesis protein TsaB
MKLLCIDTSSKEIAIGIFDGKKSVVEEYLSADRNYNAVLMPLIMKKLKSAGYAPEDIGIFASTLGPGSFTGIRVGMAAMKGFAQALGKIFTGATVLEVMARSIAGGGVVWPVIEAGRGDIYTSKWISSNGEREMKGKHILISKDAFVKKVKKNDMVAVLKLEGTASKLLALDTEIKITELEHVDMKVLASIALDRADKDGVFKYEPVYIRPSEAEAVRLKKMKSINN